MSEIETALNEIRDLLKTIPTTHPPGNRVWAHPGDSSKIQSNSFPFVVVSKMNAEEGSWEISSFGEGKHNWFALIAVYIAEGPIIVTSSENATVDALNNAHEWYKLLSDLLFENMTLNGTVDIIGDDQGNLFSYVTDNILWEGKQFYGHLFFLPIKQTIIQGVST